MKNILKLLTIALLVLGFSSCQKSALNTLKVVNIDVPVTSWEYSISLEEEKNPELKYQGNWYKATVEVPEITKSICESGLIKMYRVYDDGIQSEMPFTRQNEWYDSKEDVRYFYTEAVDYEFTVGRINIFYTVSDFDYEDDISFIPEAMKFRCVIIQ